MDGEEWEKGGQLWIKRETVGIEGKMMGNGIAKLFARREGKRRRERWEDLDG